MKVIIDEGPSVCPAHIKMMAIPFGGLSGCDIFYNKTIFAEQGIEVPETIDDLEAACAKLKEAGYTPFALANASKWTGSMYYMYLVARHSGNAEFDAAYDGKTMYMYSPETDDIAEILLMRETGSRI